MFLFIFSVTILWYLLSLGSFLPLENSGEYSILNISAFMALSLVCVFSFLSIATYLILSFIFKKENAKIISAKFSILVTTGIFLAFLLNFIHILDIYWGMGILLILIITSFVI